MDKETQTNDKSEEDKEEEVEEEEEYEEYTLVPVEKVPKKEKPKRTKILRDKEIEGVDYCPFCGNKNLAKDYQKNIYYCDACKGAWEVAEE